MHIAQFTAVLDILYCIELNLETLISGRLKYWRCRESQFVEEMQKLFHDSVNLRRGWAGAGPLDTPQPLVLQKVPSEGS